MPKLAAGILLYRQTNGELEALLVHPGGPFWAHRDNGAWSIPKGQYDQDEQPLDAAKREYEEEIGSPVPEGEMIELGEVKTPSGKVITAWAIESDLDATKVKSKTVTIFWPPGRKTEIPEIDRAEWFTLPIARIKLSRGQNQFLDRLHEKVESGMV